jgi:GTP1/Obg family GTP-binding protein
VIPPADELAASALKRSLRVAPGAGIKNEAEKERSRAAKQLDTHMKVSCSRFQMVVASSCSW